MLILTRKFKQGIIIDNKIRISVLHKGGENQLFICIEAPKNITIAREELLSEDIFKSFKSNTNVEMNARYPKLNKKAVKNGKGVKNGS